MITNVEASDYFLYVTITCINHIVSAENIYKEQTLKTINKAKFNQTKCLLTDDNIDSRIFKKNGTDRGFVNV